MQAKILKMDLRALHPRCGSVFVCMHHICESSGIVKGESTLLVVGDKGQSRLRNGKKKYLPHYSVIYLFYFAALRVCIYQEDRLGALLM